MTLAIIQVLAGLVILMIAGDYLVKGSVSIALLARVSTAVVGLTVVAMGTSLPELAVSLDAAGRGAVDLAYANIVGSCIFNVGVVLAIAVLIRPIPVTRHTLQFEYPVMFLVLIVGLLVARDRMVDRVEGAFFLVMLTLFTVFMIRLARRQVEREEAQELEKGVLRTARMSHETARAWLRSIVWIVVGAIGLAVGAELLVRGSVTVASSIGISERIIGLTVAAMGTSLPELAASVAAARRGELTIALSNVFGSNIFNILGVLGATSVVFRVPVNPMAASLDNWAMLAICAIVFPMMIWGKKLGRLDGVLLLTGFVAYMSYVLAS